MNIFHNTWKISGDKFGPVGVKHLVIPSVSGHYFRFIPWCEAAQTRLQGHPGGHQDELRLDEFADDELLCWKNLADLWNDDCAPRVHDSWRALWWENLGISSSGSCLGRPVRKGKGAFLLTMLCANTHTPSHETTWPLKKRWSPILNMLAQWVHFSCLTE